MFHLAKTGFLQAGPVTKSLYISRHLSSCLTRDFKVKNGERVGKITKADFQPLDQDGLNALKDKNYVKPEPVQVSANIPVKEEKVTKSNVSEKATSIFGDEDLTKEERKAGWKNIANMSQAEREDLLEREQQVNRTKATKNTNYIGAPIFLSFLAGFVIYCYGIETRTEEDNSLAPAAVWDRTKRCLVQSIDDYNKATKEVLLPPRQKPPPGYISLEPKYTVVCEPLNILVVPEYDLENGWKFRKLPGMNQFLDTVSLNPRTGRHNNIEFVAWSTKPAFELQNTLESLSEGRYVTLYREACRYVMGMKYFSLTEMQMPKPYYQKSLDNLGRDLTKTIIFDVDERAFELTPENGLLIPPASGRDSVGRDNLLYDLQSFIMMIAKQNVEDVRPIVRAYQKYGDKWLDEFRKNRDSATERRPPPAVTPVRRSRFGLF